MWILSFTGIGTRFFVGGILCKMTILPLRPLKGINCEWGHFGLLTIYILMISQPLFYFKNRKEKPIDALSLHSHDLTLSLFHFFKFLKLCEQFRRNWSGISWRTTWVIEKRIQSLNLQLGNLPYLSYSLNLKL